MFRKEFLMLLGLAAGIFLVVGAGGVWVGHAIKTDAAMISMDTLPGLVDAGAATALTEENWMRVHRLMNAPTGAERARLVEQIQTNSSEGLWADYGQSLYEPEDRRGYAELVATRAQYMKLRAELFGLVQAGRAAEADEFLTRQLSPAYKRYRDVSQRLFEYNAAVGKERAARVIRISRVVPWVLGGGGVLIFGFGLLVGLRGALSGLALVSRRADWHESESGVLRAKNLQRTP